MTVSSLNKLITDVSDILDDLTVDQRRRVVLALEAYANEVDRLRNDLERRVRAS